jgi:hypothetical protein
LGVSLASESIQVSDGAIAVAKWAAVALMVLDHINKYLLNGTHPIMFAAGRAAFPIFAIVLAYNLSRPGQVGIVETRLISRLIVFGLIATAPFTAMMGQGDQLFPLNVLFTLAAGSALILCLQQCTVRGLLFGVVLFLVAGAGTEFGWPGLAVMLTAWVLFRRPAAWSFGAFVLSLAGLYLVNGNWWALTGAV